MAKGTRTGVWEVYFCEWLGSKTNEELVKSGADVVKKETCLSTIREHAEKESGFQSSHDWELRSFDKGLGYIKFDDDAYDDDKRHYMKIQVYWLDEDEPLKMEWPNHRSYLVNKLKEGAERMNSLADEIAELGDNDCYNPHKLKALRILMGGPELDVKDVIKSLDADLERIDGIEQKLADQVPFDIKELCQLEIEICEDIMDRAGAIDNADPIGEALSHFVHDDVSVEADVYGEVIEFKVNKRGVVGSMKMTSQLCDWLWDWFHDKAKPITLTTYTDAHIAGIKG